jgi:DNA-nicking Smr family endonuclease
LRCKLFLSNAVFHYIAKQRKKTNQKLIFPICFFLKGWILDFGDILSQWEQQQKDAKKKQKESGKNQISHKKANAPTAEEKAMMNQKKAFDFVQENQKKVNPQELWLRRYGVVDKDSLAEQEEFRNKYKSRENLVALRPEARIDLHGLTKEGAWQRLESFISECEAKKIKKVLIIHGKGIHSHGSDPVLGEVVRKFIEIDKRLGSSGHPDSSMGGKGATWVILKNNIFR